MEDVPSIAPTLHLRRVQKCFCVRLRCNRGAMGDLFTEVQWKMFRLLHLHCTSSIAPQVSLRSPPQITFFTMGWLRLVCSIAPLPLHLREISLLTRQLSVENHISYRTSTENHIEYQQSNTRNMKRERHGRSLYGHIGTSIVCCMW